MSTKRYRLWIDTHGKPLYVEMLGDGLVSQDTVEVVRRHIDEMRLMEGKTIVLSGEWELRVLA